MLEIDIKKWKHILDIDCRRWPLEINDHMVIFQYDGCSFINIQKEKLIPNQQEDSYVIQSKKS